VSDLVRAARVVLVNEPTVTNLLGSSDLFAVWIFRWSSFEIVEGSGLVALTLRQPGGWTVPNRHNTARFPLLETIVYADRSRDSEGRPTKEDAQERALQVTDAVDAVLHVPQGGDISWDGVRVLSSVRQSEPDIVTVPDGDGLCRASVRYAVVLG
jgi:hypothetical protein